MKNKNFYTRLALLFLLTVISSAGFSQFKLKGTIFDSTGKYPMEAVSVLLSNGHGTTTNDQGKYEITVNEGDSIWFSYLNKPTRKYAVSGIYDASQFNLALHLRIDPLKEIKIKQRNYRQDSIQNRIDYAKVFDFEKGKLTPSVTTSGVGFDMNEIIKMFQFRKNKNMLKLQNTLLKEEEDKYIEHRFSRGLVRKLTNISDDDIDTFMMMYKPPYEALLFAPEYEFQQYIKESYREFLQLKHKGELKKRSPAAF